MRIVAISQARMGSTRLPGKVLRKVHGKPLLYYHITRLRRSKLIDTIVVATTTNAKDARIVNLCNLYEWNSYRGSEQDVLDRYYGAASKFKAGIVVRVTSDCPMIDHEIVDRVIRHVIDNNLDYGSNILNRTYPRGLDAEVITFNALQRAWKEAKLPFEREHVTPYIHQNPDKFKISGIEFENDESQYRWTVDTIEDFQLVSRIFNEIGCEFFSWKDALRLMKKRPDLYEINKNIEQKGTKDRQ